MTRSGMARWLVALVVTVVSATAGAEPAAIETTTRAYNTSMIAERQVGQLAARRNALAQRWQDELHAVDRLKNSPRSWRRDRELRDKLSEANEVGQQLETANAELATAQSQLAVARRALIAAIDTELAGHPTVDRRTRLDKARAAIVPPSRKARRIVLPDMQIDPLADPEELDQQASAFRETELELRNQIKGLEAQAAELERIAMLRKEHDRSREMDRRDDNNSRKAATPHGDAVPTVATDGAAELRSDSGFEFDASITLAEVVDPSTIDSLNRAQRSGDPSQRAAAATQARDAVAKKLEQLRAKRRQIETRSKQLRGRT